MRALHYFLLILSGLHQVRHPLFFEGLVYLWMILVIILQLRWFEIDSDRLKRAWDGGAIVLYLVLIGVGGQVDLYLFFLMISHFSQAYQQKNYVLASLVVFVATLGMSLSQSQPLGMDRLGLIVVAGWVGYLFNQMTLTTDLLMTDTYKQAVQKGELLERQTAWQTEMKDLVRVQTLEERNRMTRDIHDTAGHTLSTVMIQLEAFQQLAKQADQEELATMADQLKDFSREGLNDLRQVIHQVKPQHASQFNFLRQLKDLIESFQYHTAIRVDLKYNPARFDLTSDQQEALYRAVQESLSNTSKHSRGATQVSIRLHYTSKALIVSMKDNGEGVDEIRPSVGLTGMKERIQLAAGRVSFSSNLGQGFQSRMVFNRRSTL